MFGRGYRFMDRKELLSFEEIERLAGAFVAHGVEKIRITGGEPLLRRDLELLIERLAALGGLDVALTTNGGALLPQKAEALVAAGLQRVTISLEDAIAYAAALATEHFRFFIDFGRVPQARPLPAEGVAITGGLRMKLERLIDDLGLSVRSLNSLKNSNIRTLRDLVEFSEEELLEGQERRREGRRGDRRAAAARGTPVRHGLRRGRRRPPRREERRARLPEATAAPEENA